MAKTYVLGEAKGRLDRPDGPKVTGASAGDSAAWSALIASPVSTAGPFAYVSAAGPPTSTGNVGVDHWDFTNTRWYRVQPNLSSWDPLT